MNFELEILSARNIPEITGKGSPSPFIDVFQTSLKKTLIGSTPVKNKTSNPEFNTQIKFHGIRGFSFSLNVMNYDEEGNHDLIGTANLSQYNLHFETLTTLQVSDNRGEIDLIIHKLDSQVERSEFPINHPLPERYVMYISLSFEPYFIPSFPIPQRNMNFSGIPLDITIVGFNCNGEVTHIEYNGEPHLYSGLYHTGLNLSYCYDTYSPSIRIDIEDVFYSEKRASCAVVLVQCTDKFYMLSASRWIAADIYLTDEKYRRRDLLPRFLNRIQILNTNGSISAAFTLTPTKSGLIVQPCSWIAPNTQVTFPPESICEILPELAMLFGLNHLAAKRSIAVYQHKSSSLIRALSMYGISIRTPILVSLSSGGTSEYDASCVVFDKGFKFLRICYYNKAAVFDGSILHHSRERDKGYGESFTVNFSNLPKNAHFLCFLLNNKVNDIILQDITLKFSVGQAELFKIQVRKGEPNRSLFLCIIYRGISEDWGILPIKKFGKAYAINKMGEFLLSELRRIFIV